VSDARGSLCCSLTRLRSRWSPAAAVHACHDAVMSMSLLESGDRSIDFQAAAWTAMDAHIGSPSHARSLEPWTNRISLRKTICRDSTSISPAFHRQFTNSPRSVHTHYTDVSPALHRQFTPSPQLFHGLSTRVRQRFHGSRMSSPQDFHLCAWIVVCLAPLENRTSQCGVDCLSTQFRRLNERAMPDAGRVWILRAPPGLSRWVVAGTGVNQQFRNKKA
jgi:hypothetical protein